MTGPQGVLYLIRRYVAPVLLTLTLGSAVGGGGAYVVNEEHQRSAEVQQIYSRTQQAERDLQRRLELLEKRETLLQSDEHHLEPGPHGPCLCVAKTLGTAPPGFIRCSLAAECNAEAVRACEQAFGQQLRCGPLVAD